MVPPSNPKLLFVTWNLDTLRGKESEFCLILEDSAPLACALQETIRHEGTDPIDIENYTVYENTIPHTHKTKETKQKKQSEDYCQRLATSIRLKSCTPANQLPIS